MFWLLKLSSCTGSNKSAKRALLYIGNNVTNMLNTKQEFVNEMFWNTCTSFNTSYNSLVPAIFYLIFHIYMFCRFVAIGLIHSDKASLKTDSNLCEKHQINLIDGISCQKSLIRAFFLVPYSLMCQLMPRKLHLPSLPANSSHCFMSENMSFTSWEPRLYKENKYVLTSKSSGLTKKHIYTLFLSDCWISCTIAHDTNKTSLFDLALNLSKTSTDTLIFIRIIWEKVYRVQFFHFNNIYKWYILVTSFSNGIAHFKQPSEITTLLIG